MKSSVPGASSLALVLLAACAAPNPKPSVEPAAWKPSAEKPPSSPPEPIATAKDFVAPAKDPAADPHATDSVVARVAGKPIYVSELLTQWLYMDALRARDHLMNLATNRIVLAEAARLRVVVESDAATKAYDQAIAGIESEFKNTEVSRKYPKLTFDDWVDRQLGLDPARYRERIHDVALKGLLADRVTRAWLLQQEHVEVRVIVLSSENDLKAAQQDLADGKSFEDVALARSQDPSKKNGGVLAPLVRSSAPISKAAFDAPIGAVGPPITDAGVWLLFRVDARPPPLEGDWARIGPAVEASLKQRKIDPNEVEQWLRAMTARYEVDVSAFRDLVGETKR